MNPMTAEALVPSTLIQADSKPKPMTLSLPTPALPNEDSMSIPSPDDLEPVVPIFEVNEKVICFHGRLMYNAKILKLNLLINPEDPSIKEYIYLVHFEGWSKRWDSWVESVYILKLNPENIKKQEQLMKAVGEEEGAIEKSVLPKKIHKNRVVTIGKPPQPQDPNLSHNEAEVSIDNVTHVSQVPSTVETAAHFACKQAVEIKFPQSLQLALVIDWEMITQYKLLMAIPAVNTINQILNAYMEEESGNSTQKKLLCKELKELFYCTSHSLFYQQEKAQFNHLLKLKTESTQENDKLPLRKYPRSKKNLIMASTAIEPQLNDVSPSQQILTDNYGVVHLIRLLSKVGVLGGLSNFEPDDFKCMQESLEHLIAFLDKNLEKYFSFEHYNSSAKEYQEKKKLETATNVESNSPPNDDPK